MDSKHYDQILEAIKDRSQWEVRQDRWYCMRYKGIRRAKRPYPNAPDVHYPLADTIIEKLKPFYAQQMYAQERIATFISQNGNSREVVSMAEQWFDYQMKQRSNFETQLMIGMDTHLTYGLCPVKIYWHEQKGQICFDAIDPLYVIVPSWTEDLQSADWLVHVKRLSRTQYEADPNYKQGAIVDLIVGGGDSDSRIDSLKKQDVELREGITCTNEKDQIILWECYYREGGKWVIETIAPAYSFDKPVRAPYGLPYSHGKLPFVALQCDISQKGWYSSRGIPEIVQEYELSLCKSWNSKLQYLDFFGQPNFKNTSLTPVNAQNFSCGPGDVLPPGIEKDAGVSAPLDFEQEMQFVRALAEDRIAIPDLSNNEHLTGTSSSSERTTATQVRAIVGLSSQSNDLRSRMFRLQLAEIYRQSWAILAERAADQLQFIYANEVGQLPPEALQDAYTITPSGSADSWDIESRVQEAVAYYNMLLGKPNVNQDELVKFLLESGKQPRLVKRLFLDTGMQAQLQGERQAQEITSMLIGYPVQPKQDDNDDAHIQTIDGFLQRRLQTGEPITPEFGQLMLQHRGGHVMQAKAKRNPNTKMFQDGQNQLQQLFQKAIAIAQQPPALAPSPNGQQPVEQPQPVPSPS